MKTFKLIPYMYDDKTKIFKKKTVTIESGVTVLVGCNGFGKTSFLKCIKKCLNDEDLKYIWYDNLHDGGHNSISKALFNQDFTFGATAFCSSEGEQIAMNLQKLSQNIGWYINNTPDQNELFILLDAIDSGFSVDNVQDVKKYLFAPLAQLCAKNGKTVYIIVSANEYEMVRGERCFDIYTGKYREFKTYNAYKNYILRTRDIKDKRYGITEES